MERRERITQLQQELSQTFQQARIIQQEISVLWEQELNPNTEVEIQSIPEIQQLTLDSLE